MIPVAQYVRMSTDHQRYSIANQEDQLSRFAAANGMEVIRSFVDRGKSGLTFQGRKGLQALICEVQGGACEFHAVLVLDVTRWGRFQDADESAFYEFLCKRAGAPVVYCEESFSSSEGPMSAVLKGVKRAMAAEFSKELSGKVFVGQSRLIRMGFWQGGPAGYGMRRALISSNGGRRPLKAGERKSLQTDRVVVIPGSRAEISIVRKVFRWFVVDRLNETKIAARLNNAGHRTQHGRPWIRESITRIIGNEIYAGTMVWNRTTRRLGAHHRRTPAEAWIRGATPLPGIVSRATFDAARKIVVSRKEKFLDERMLFGLRAINQSEGRVTSGLIDTCAYTPYSAAYRAHFGSVAHACELAGCPQVAGRIKKRG